MMYLRNEVRLMKGMLRFVIVLLRTFVAAVSNETL